MRSVRDSSSIRVRPRKFYIEGELCGAFAEANTSSKKPTGCLALQTRLTRTVCLCGLLSIGMLCKHRKALLVLYGVKQFTPTATTKNPLSGKIFVVDRTGISTPTASVPLSHFREIGMT